jgi:predicted PurR-regulated permease PerM
MIETSKDFLYIVLAFSVLWLTIFLSWVLYYVIVILKQINQIVQNFREKIERISQTMEKIKEKFECTSAYLGIIVKAVEKMVGFVTEKKGKKK